MQIDRTAEQWNDHPYSHLGPHYDTHWSQASQGGCDAIGRGPSYHPMITPQREAQVPAARGKPGSLVPAAWGKEGLPLHEFHALGLYFNYERQVELGFTLSFGGFSSVPLCSRQPSLLVLASEKQPSPT